MSENRITSFSISPDLDREILRLKKTPEFERASYSAVVRHLLLLGLDAVKKENSSVAT